MSHEEPLFVDTEQEVHSKLYRQPYTTTQVILYCNYRVCYNVSFCYSNIRILNVFLCNIPSNTER